MGRRKIEIQPITHERNRSVTFLKRKNGLFKKAYELGVLCSVDVAVIIFEARPGHEVKLHEYSSTDIRNIVQRQTRHEGDIDLKVPADFSNSANKFDDGGDGDGDDDNGDEEEDVPATKPGRRRAQGRLALPLSPLHPDDYSVPLPPPPPPAHHLHPESGGVSSLSVANDRVSNMRDLHPSRSHKRPRNTRSRSPSEDNNNNMMPALPAMNSEWGISQDDHGLGRYGRNMRHVHNQQPPPPPPGLSQQQQHQQYHSMHPQQHAGHGFQYTPMFPVPNQVSPPPPSFIPLHQDFGPSRGLPSFASRPGGSGGAEGGNGYVDLHQRMRPSDTQSYDPASYTTNPNSLTRHSEHHHHHHHHHQQQHQQSLLSPPPPPPAAAAPHRRDDRGVVDGHLGGNLLEADERNRQRGGMDWPMHDELALSARSGPTGPRGSLDGPGISNPPNGSDSWFDFLSRSNPVNENQAASGSSSSSTGGRRNSSSTWPRNSSGDTHKSSTDDISALPPGSAGGSGLFDGRKESAVRGENVGGGRAGGGGGGGQADDGDDVVFVDDDDDDVEEEEDKKDLELGSIPEDKKSEDGRDDDDDVKSEKDKT